MPSTNDLVPQSALKELALLETELEKSQTKMQDMLKDAAALKDTLTAQSTSYEGLSETIKDYNDLEREVSTTIKEHNKVLEQIQKLKEKVLQSDSKEVEALREWGKQEQERHNRNEQMKR
jgi:hypothetical protein